MGSAVRPAKTSPGPWDAFADVDAFVDEVLAELKAIAKDGTRPQQSGPKPPLAGAALRKAVMAIRCICFSVCNGERSDSCAIFLSTHSVDCSPAGPGSASGVGCGAVGGAPAVMLRNRAPWSSTAAPAARAKLFCARH
jgi:hypothetical protein